MNPIFQPILQEIKDAFQNSWNKLGVFHPREAMAVGNGAIGILLIIVNYEQPGSVGLQFLTT